MKRKLFSQTMFIAKSLLWSLLLYVTTMTIINWDDIARKNKAVMPMVTRTSTDQQEASISGSVAPYALFRPFKLVGAKLVQAVNTLY